MNHSFDIDDAVLYGVECATILNNIRFWLEKNKANKSNAVDGYYWTFNSVKSWSELFPYFSESQIKRYLKKLLKDGILMSGNHNKKGYDRTKWYTIPNEYLIVQNRPMDGSESSNALDDIVQPIPDINTDINTDIKNTGVALVKYDHGDFKFAKYMYQNIHQRFPHKKPPNYEKWSYVIRKMRLYDGEVINDKPQGMLLNDMWTTFMWAINHNFWFDKVQSPEKFRKNYGTIVVQMKTKPTTGNSGRDEVREKLMNPADTNW